MVSLRQFLDWHMCLMSFTFLNSEKEGTRAKQKRGVLSKEKRFWGILDDGYGSAGRQGLTLDLQCIAVGRLTLAYYLVLSSSC
jgi:hypothetical protein